MRSIFFDVLLLEFLRVHLGLFTFIGLDVLSTPCFLRLSACMDWPSRVEFLLQVNHTNDV